MKRRKFIVRAVAVIIAVLLAVSLLWPVAATIAYGDTGEQDLTILFTHDMHDHILPVGETDSEGNSVSYGGFARLMTALNSQRSAHSRTVTVDAGDFSMGTLFQTITTTDAPELRLLGAMGYDAVTFGNHEFDFGCGETAKMLEAAKASGDTLPAIVEANYTPDESGADFDAAAKAFADVGVSEYTIIDADGINVAVFGLFGDDADSCAPNSNMIMTDKIEAAQQTVERINAESNADIIVCLSHSGTSATEVSEDEEIAKAVDGIDVIISGHTHTTLNEPITVNNCTIVSCGSFCRNLGSLTVTKADGGWSVADYQLIPINDSLAEDAGISDMIQDFKNTIDEKYLADYDYDFDHVIAENSIAFTPVSAIEQIDETGLGNFLSDSYIYAVKAAGAAAEDEHLISVVPAGIIRGSLPKGDITVSDAFNILPLGIGADGTSGYPLISVYLTPAELKALAEIDVSVGPGMTTAFLNIGGLSYTYNPNRIMLDRVTDVTLLDGTGNRQWMDKDGLYRVVTDLYSAQMFATVEASSFGFLKIIPKDENGNEIADLSDMIILDNDGNELKSWSAAAAYLTYMGGEDGSGYISDDYAKIQNRKVIEDKNDFFSIISSPGKPTCIALSVCAVLCVIFGLIVWFVLKRMLKNDSVMPEDRLSH